MTLADVLEHASRPAACYRLCVPAEAAKAEEAGLITIRDAGYSQETVYLVGLTEAGRQAQDREG